MNEIDIFDGHGILVDIKSPDNFLKIVETLERIGIPDKDRITLYQSCHILHRKDAAGYSFYAIVSFKELFMLGGRDSDITETDYLRRDAICKLLQDWGLLNIVDNAVNVEYNTENRPFFKIISYSDRDKWDLVQKYKLGK